MKTPSISFLKDKRNITDRSPRQPAIMKEKLNPSLVTKIPLTSPAIPVPKLKEASSKDHSARPGRIDVPRKYGSPASQGHGKAQSIEKLENIYVPGVRSEQVSERNQGSDEASGNHEKIIISFSLIIVQKPPYGENEARADAPVYGRSYPDDESAPPDYLIDDENSKDRGDKAPSGPESYVRKNKIFNYSVCPHCSLKIYRPPS